jgi:hypothetical protein
VVRSGRDRPTRTPGTIRQIPLWVSMAGTLILVVGWAISFVLMGPAP